MYRKTNEVVGYAPADGGYLLCVGCHGRDFPDHNQHDCECDAIFLGSETEGPEHCDSCREEIETTAIGAD
jgi:hypothetical protein